MLISEEDIIEGKLRGYFLFEDIEYNTDDWIEIISVLYENGIEDLYFKDTKHIKKVTITKDQLFRIRIRILERHGDKKIMKEKPLK